MWTPHILSPQVRQFDNYVFVWPFLNKMFLSPVAKNLIVMHQRKRNKSLGAFVAAEGISTTRIVQLFL